MPFGVALAMSPSAEIILDPSDLGEQGGQWAGKPREYRDQRWPFNNTEYITETALVKSSALLELLYFFLKSTFTGKLGI